MFSARPPGRHCPRSQAIAHGAVTLDLLQIVATFDEAGVKLEVLTGAFNREDPWGRPHP